MGDGSVPKTNDGSHGLFRLPMVNKQFLEWFDHEMGILSTGVVLKKTAAELARNNRESGFSPDAKAENYIICTRLYPGHIRLCGRFDSGISPVRNGSQNISR